MKNVVLITNNINLSDTLKNNGLNRGYHVLTTFTSKVSLIDDFSNLESTRDLPDLALVTEGFDTSDNTPTWEMILRLKQRFPLLRIIYATGQISPDDSNKLRVLARLVKGGVYDILIGNRIDEAAIYEIMDNPRTFEDVASYLEYEKSDTDFDRSKGFSNVVLVSSIKPGSGKTFLATNLAIAIAKYGQFKRGSDGQLIKPRVAIVDGNLLNLSVSSMLRVDNFDKNMITALNQIKRYVSKDGTYSLNDDELVNIKNFVRGCLTRHKEIDNLYCMVAPTSDLSSLSDIYPVHFFFMMEQLVKAFDVIIVDSNSAFDHQTTAALFELAAEICLVMDLDYNNLQNNVRYFDKLKDLGYEHKIHYIINKDLPLETLASCVVDLAYDLQVIQEQGIAIEHRVPMVNNAKMKSLDYNAIPLIDDNTSKTEAARIAILEIANDIWKIDRHRLEARSEDSEELKSSKISLLDKLSDKIVDVLNN